MRAFTRKVELNIGMWGCVPTNLTGSHLADIMQKYEQQYTINKINRLLCSYYNKMNGLVGTGKYQEYYMLLVRKDNLSLLQEIEVANQKTKTHATSLMLMIHRTFIGLDYDENNPNPKV